MDFIWRRVLFIVLMLICYDVAQADSVVKQSKILGIQLGMASDEAISALNKELPNAKIQKKIGTLQLNSYTSPPVYFGLVASDSVRQINHDSEEIKLDFDAIDSKVIFISRSRIFSKGSAPLVSSFLKDITEKYGQPSWSQGYSQGHKLVWIGDSNVRSDRNSGTLEGEKFFRCYDSVSAVDGPFNLYLNSGRVDLGKGWPFMLLPCGTVMTIDVTPMAPDYTMVSNFTIYIGDYIALDRSSKNILERLRQGAAGAKGSIEDAAKGNRAKL